MKNFWRLDCGSQTLLLGGGHDLAQVFYWGARLPDIEQPETIWQATRLDYSGGVLDGMPPLSICPEVSKTFAGHPGLRIRAITGARIEPTFVLTSAQHSTDALTLEYSDIEHGLTYQANFLAQSSADIIEITASLTSKQDILVDWFAAPVLPAPQTATQMIDFSGHWCREFHKQETAWSVGARLRNNQTGRTGHEHFPALIVPETGCTNTHGSVYAWHYGWSGGHSMIAEELPDGRRQVQFGHAFDAHPKPTRQVETAPLFVSFSENGLNALSVNFQRHLRDNIVTWTNESLPRPVHYNCWEAIYFDHSIEALSEIVEQAAEIGAERFVLDDGWFGTRDDDTQSLGDWDIDPRKYPNGLAPLIAKVNEQGMSFGIWFEPEMINPNSDLYRRHPEWVLGPLDQLQGRGQLVLDMANADVRDYLFSKISAILSDHNVSYIKWDHNRVLPHVDAAQTHGTYNLLARLRDAHPDVEIESCSSGGGRIDFGIMRYTQRVWLSDSNDAAERLRMQHEASHFLPLAVTGSHLGPRECHTSGRIHDIGFRAWVAAQRHMGFEMDPRELTDVERAKLRNVTQWWKDNRDWRHTADIKRLSAADPAIIAEIQVSSQQDRFVAFIGNAETSAWSCPASVQLTGLKHDTLYSVTLVNRDEKTAASRGISGFDAGTLKLSGRFLMSHGVDLPSQFPDRMWVLEGVAE